MLKQHLVDLKSIGQFGRGNERGSFSLFVNLSDIVGFRLQKKRDGNDYFVFIYNASDQRAGAIIAEGTKDICINQLGEIKKLIRGTKSLTWAEIYEDDDAISLTNISRPLTIETRRGKGDHYSFVDMINISLIVYEGSLEECNKITKEISGIIQKQSGFRKRSKIVRKTKRLN